MNNVSPAQHRRVPRTSATDGETVDRGRIRIRRRHALPFLQTETRTERFGTPGEAPAVQGRSVRLWPVASYRREADRSRFRMPALWPTADLRPVERSWAPLWTLAERRTDGETADTEILWGLFRRRIRADGERRTALFPFVEWGRSRAGGSGWKVFKGLFGMHRHEGRTRLQLLYLFTRTVPAGDGP